MHDTSKRPAPRTAPPSRSTADEGHRGPAAGVVSCVLDAHPRFSLEVLRWFASATKLARIEPADLRVHIVGPPNEDIVSVLRSRGAVVRHVDAFDHRSPHCNKVAGVLSMAGEQDAGICALTDADTVFLEDPRTIELPSGSVGMRPVDLENPPVDVLERVFEAAGVATPPEVALPWSRRSFPRRRRPKTLAGNGNGGLYVVPAPLLDEVGRAWATWAAWLLDRPGYLGAWAIHVDQVAMALALAAEDIEVFHLDPRWNVPTHLAGVIPRQPFRPSTIHYHDNVDAIGQIAFTGRAHVDRAIATANAATNELWQDVFPNSTFWNWRYATNPQLGSGIGSRGRPLEDKRHLLDAVLTRANPTSVLDIGCGDGEATRELPIPHYTGVDISEEAVKRAVVHRPDGTYLVGSPTDLALPGADLVLCLDVLIHQAELGSYRAIVGSALGATRSVALVSGYEREHQSSSPMVFFHEPLSTTIGALDPSLEWYPVREEHSISTLLVVRPDVDPSVRASLRDLALRDPAAG